MWFLVTTDQDTLLCSSFVLPCYIISYLIMNLTTHIYNITVNLIFIVFVNFIYTFLCAIIFSLLSLVFCRQAYLLLFIYVFIYFT